MQSVFHEIACGCGQILDRARKTLHCPRCGTTLHHVEDVEVHLTPDVPLPFLAAV